MTKKIQIALTSEDLELVKEGLGYKTKLEGEKQFVEFAIGYAVKRLRALHKDQVKRAANAPPKKAKTKKAPAKKAPAKKTGTKKTGTKKTGTKKTGTKKAPAKKASAPKLPPKA